MEGASLTRQSSRDRVQTPMALEWSKRRSRAVSNDIEDTIEVIEETPAAPQAKRMEISSHPKERIVATKVKALAAKAGERPATMAATPSQPAHEKANTGASAQIKALTDLVKSLLKAMEGQTSAMEELKKEHANQIEALTRTFTGQIETLKAEVAQLIQEQLANVQPPQVHHHRMRRSQAHHRAVGQAMYEPSPRWVQHHQR
jgi:phage-related minor tail protein